MTTITLPRAVVEQALEALSLALSDVNWRADSPTQPVIHKAHAALRAALAQQDEPNAHGYASRLAFAIWKKHYKDIAPQWKPLDDLMGVLTQIDNMTSGLTLLAQQAEPVKPVAWVNQANLASARLTRDRGGQGDTHTWSETRSNYHGVPLYTAPPQRKPLPKHDQHCVDVPGYGLTAVRLVRAVERAHGIKEN